MNESNDNDSTNDDTTPTSNDDIDIDDNIVDTSTSTSIPVAFQYDSRAAVLEAAISRLASLIASSSDTAWPQARQADIDDALTDFARAILFASIPAPPAPLTPDTSPRTSTESR